MSLNYKQLGDLSKAMVYNTWATERDPKCTNDSFIFDRSFVSTPVMSMADHLGSGNGTGGIMGSRNASFSISGAGGGGATTTTTTTSSSGISGIGGGMATGRRTSESMQHEEPSSDNNNRLSSDLFASD